MKSKNNIKKIDLKKEIVLAFSTIIYILIRAIAYSIIPLSLLLSYFQQNPKIGLVNVSLASAICALLWFVQDKVKIKINEQIIRLQN